MQELAVDVLGVISALLPKAARDQFRLVSRDWYAAVVTTHLTEIRRPRLLLPAWERHLLEGGRWARVTEVSGLVAANLAELPEVVQQSLRRVTFNTAPSAVALAALAQCAGLRALDVTHASGAMLLAVAGSRPDLEELVLHELPTEDVSVGLAAMPGLKRLHAMLAKQITDAGLAGLRSLEELTLVDCVGLTDAGLAALVGVTRNLRAVRLRSAFDCKLTSQGALALIRGSPNLTELELPRGVLANDDTLEALARCKGLRALTAFTGRPCTDAGIAALAGGCRRLQVLRLRLAGHSDGHEAVSGAGVVALARGCPALRHVELRVPLRLVTVADAAALAAACPDLYELVPRGSSTLTAAGIQALRRLPAADPLRKRALDAEAVLVLNAALALCTGTSQQQ